MREWTEQEEQQMIALAKQGDPQANYELSLWALRRGEEEPDESRWNRLAAKCLVKAAQAGYAPAQARMAELLQASKANAEPEPEPEPEPAFAPEPEPEARPIRQSRPAPREPVRLSDARQTARRGQTRPAAQSTARRPSRYSAEPEDDYAPEDMDDGYDDYDDYDDAPRGGRRPRGRGNTGRGAAGGVFADWNERQWRRLEIICVAICAVLLVVIAIMVITGRGGSGDGGSSTIPTAGDASATATQPPVQADYPPDDVIQAIQAAELEIPPLDDEYVTVPTTATVRVNSTSLRLRTGPNTEYSIVTSMPNDTVVDIYAKKNDWCLVKFDDPEEGTVYGWCSSEYLFITAGAADPGVG